MKKIVSVFTIMALILLLIFGGNSYAATLDTIDIQPDKTTVRPGEEVTITIEFGKELGEYTFDVFYDNKIFDYVSAEGGTANDTTDKVRVVYEGTTRDTTPRTNMSVTFKAKDDITTSNPTEFTITAEGLKSADLSESYDDITTPIVKNITVEPEYVNYTIDLESTGEIVKGQEKEMKLSYSSPMGHYYEHARLIAEAVTPAGADVELLATDEADLEHDIIQSGWGDAQGYNIGGKDFSQVLQTRAKFSNAGDYTITLKLIDRDNSDTIIAEKSFEFTVLETATPTDPEDTEKPGETETPTPPEDTDKPGETETPTPPEDTEKPGETETPTTPENTEKPENNVEQAKPEEKPTELPKTGNNIYLPIIGVLVALISSFVIFNKWDNPKQRK